MWPFLKQLLEQKYYVIVFLFGAFFSGVSCITLNKQDASLVTHAPTPLALFALGLTLIIISLSSFFYISWRQSDCGKLDLNTVTESRGTFSTQVDSCKIRVVKGKLEDYSYTPRSVVVLPCNEFFDDECASDTRSALGAYVNSIFKNRCTEFALLVREQCSQLLGPGVEQDKTKTVRAISYGVGECLLLKQPLEHNVSIALLSTTTQRSQDGLVGSVSYLFDGIRNLFKSTAEARLNELVMPLLGSGHGGVGRPLAFIGLLMAIAEAVRRGHGGHRDRKITIVIYKKDKNTPAEIDDVVIRRGLALVGSMQTSVTKPVPMRPQQVV